MKGRVTFQMNDRVVRGPISITQKPWGGEELLAHTELYALKRIYIKPGLRPSLQYHERKSESLYLLSGQMKIEIGDSVDSLVTDELLPGESVDIPRGKIHRVTALEDSVLIEVSTPELDDVVRLEDDYGRES
ncbi:MAG: cupin [Armatimonadetes bacterium]|nr:cupin [Armatimonadota bacterium]